MSCFDDAQYCNEEGYGCPRSYCRGSVTLDGGKWSCDTCEFVGTQDENDSDCDEEEAAPLEDLEDTLARLLDNVASWRVV